MHLFPVAGMVTRKTTKKNFQNPGYFVLLCESISSYFNFNIQKNKRMKKFFAILAIVALASCGGAEEAPAADTTAVEAPAVDTAAADTAAAAVDTAAAPAEAK